MSLNFGSNLFSGREALINFDFIDIADGTGYVAYYGALSNDGTYITTPNANTSSELIKTTVSKNWAVDFTEEFNIDFDITFQVPKNIKGDILVNVPSGIAAESASQTDVQWYIIAKAFHFDGTTETQLGATAQSRTYSGVDLENDVAGSERTSHSALLKINQATIKHFSAGETLRITVEMWIKNFDTVISQAAIAHDPTNRADLKEQLTGDLLQTIQTGEPTRLSIQVPFRLDI